MSGEKIWLVTSGCYSDYQVLAAYRTEEDARAALARGYGEAVEDFPLLADGSLPVRRDEWFVRISRLVGQWVAGDPRSEMTWDVHQIGETGEIEEVRPQGYRDYGYVRGFDRDRVVRAAQDMVAFLRAYEAGLT